MDDFLFVVSKILHTLVEPDSLAVLSVAIGAALLWWRPMVGRWIVSGAAVVLLAISTLPIGAWLLIPLEERFPRPQWSAGAEVDGVVVLGGSVDPLIAERRDVIALRPYAERIAEMVMLANRFPNARIVHSGGTADIRQNKPTEASAIAPFFEPLGIQKDRVVLEDRSRNTHENAVFTRQLVQPKPGETWLLVTSAFHMPRAVGAFRGAGWGDIIPFPVDYQTSGEERLLQLAPVGRWWTLGLAVHEYAGLISYYLAGRSPSLFPAPDGG